MLQWELHQKHETDHKEALKKMGEIHKRDPKWFFSGPTFWPIFKEMGHTSGDYRACDCWRKAGYSSPRETREEWMKLVTTPTP